MSNSQPIESSFPPPELAASAEQVENSNRFLAAGKKATEATVIFAAVGPFSGPLRYGAFGATLAATESTPASAAVLGVSTLILEGAGAFATSNALASKRADKTLKVVNGLLNKVLPSKARLNPVAEIVIANYAGSSALLVAKQREDPARTKEQNRKYGARTATWLGGALAVQGALIAEGVTNATDPKVVGPSVLLLGGIMAVGSRAKKKINRTEANG